MPATLPNTLSILQSVQSLIIANTGTTFAALAAADQARYGVARAVYIGAPKDFKDAYLPQCHIIPESDHIAVTGAQARVTDTISVRVRAVVDFTDWWAAEQQILAIRDLLLPLFVTHVRAGAAPGGVLVALDTTSFPHGTFATFEVAGVWYRSWSCTLAIRQIFVPVGGYVA